MGYSDLGCYGSEINTPNLDQLAARGIRFSQFYNSARCCPSRAALLTGYHPHQVGMGGMVNTKTNPKLEEGPYQGYISDKVPTLAEILKSAGYFTAMVGKWHVGESYPSWPRQRGFDRYFGLISGASSYYEVLPKRIMLSQNEVFSPPAGFYATDAFGDTAVNYIYQAKQNATPFLLYAAFTAPHWPLHAPDSVVGKYRSVYIRGYDVLRQERLDKLKALGLVSQTLTLPEREGGKPWSEVTNKLEEAEKMAVYAAMVEILDRNVGKMIDALKQSGQFDNTVILFLSDNGGCHENIRGRTKQDILPADTVLALSLPAGPIKSYQTYGMKWANLSNVPFRHHKSTIHEGGIATPFIFKPVGKTKRPGSIVQGQGFITDIVPTCLDWAGVPKPVTFNGVKQISLVGKNLTKVFSAQDRTYCWEHEGAKGIRRGKYKLVARKNAAWELYDLESDRNERNNLAQAQSNLVSELDAEWKRWASAVGAKSSEKSTD